MCVGGGGGKTDSKPVNKQLQELISDNDKLWGDNNRLDDGTELDLWKRTDRYHISGEEMVGQRPECREGGDP